MFWEKQKKNNYEEYLENEIDTLKRKVKQVELERDNAIKQKENYEKNLNKYKSEYELLIADSKKLLEKQKKANKTIDKIISDCRSRLENYKIK